MEYVFLEIIAIANNRNTVVSTKLAKYFVKILEFLIEKCPSKQNVVRFKRFEDNENEDDSFRYKELYTPVIEYMKESSAPIDQLVHFYWTFDLVLNDVHRKSLAINLLLKNCDSVIGLLKSPNICYFILGIFKMTIDQLGEIETSKLSSAFYDIYHETGEAWIKDYIKDIFLYFYKEKTFLSDISNPKSLELLMLICIFVKRHESTFRKEEFDKVKTLVMTAIGNGNAFKEHHSSKVYSDFVSTVGLNFPDVLSAITKGLNIKDLPVKTRVNYIEGIASIFGAANDKLKDPEILQGVVILSKHLADRNQLVRDACVEHFTQFAYVVPYEGFLLAILRLPEEDLTCTHFKVFSEALKLSITRSPETSLKEDIAGVFLNYLKFKDIDTEGTYNPSSKIFHKQNVYNLIDALDFESLKYLILKPLNKWLEHRILKILNKFDFPENNGNIPNFSIILEIVFERHVAFLSKENKDFLSECLLTALKYEIRILNSISHNILNCCKDLDFEFLEVKILPILCVVESPILFDGKFMEFTSKTYANLKSHQPLLKNKFFQVLESSNLKDDYSEFLKVLSTVIIEKELLPKMLAFPPQGFLDFCHNSFGQSYNNLQIHHKDKVKQTLTSILEQPACEINFTAFISIMNHYELKGRSIFNQLSRSLDKMLDPSNNIGRVDKNLYFLIEKYIDELKETVVSNFESLIGSYKPRNKQVCTFLWGIICRNKSKINEYEKLKTKIEGTDFEYEAKRIFQSE